MYTKMTYADYREKVLASLAHYFKTDAEYIAALDARGCIRRSYKEDADLSEMFSTDRFDPSGFAYGCHMLYPDFPDGDETDADKPVFDFKFNAARKK